MTHAAAPHRQHRRSGRARLLGALALTSGLLLAACGSPDGSGGDAPGRAAEGDEPSDLPECPLDALDEADGPVRVNLWFGGIVEPPVGVLNSLIEDFNASQDQIVVTGNDQGTSYDEVLRQYERTASTPGQLPDIIYMEDNALGQLVDRGQLLPAQSCMEADGYDPDLLVPAARAAAEVEGVLYPGYMNVSSPILYYNQAHFFAAGLDPDDPPQTLDELEGAARQIKEAGVSPRPLSFVTSEWFFQTWIAGLGEDMVDNDNGRSAPATEALLDTPDTLALMQWLADMNDEELLNPFPVTDGGIDHYLALITQQSSMLMETSTASSTIAEALGGGLTAEEAGLEVDPGLLEDADLVPASAQFPGIREPGQVAAGGGYFYLLNTGSPAEQAGAWRFLRFMLEPENSKRWHIEGGYLPVVQSVLDDPEVAEFQATDLGGLLIAPSAEQMAAADPDRTAPLIGPFTAYNRAVQGAMEAVLFSGADPAQALASANQTINAALDDYNQ
jgi:sn-glycerol 3-phosphate transport system substrate-binding protein